MIKLKPLTKFQEILAWLRQLNSSINRYHETIQRVEHHVWNLESHVMRVDYTLSQMDAFNKVEASQNATVQHIAKLVEAQKEKHNPFKSEKKE